MMEHAHDHERGPDPEGPPDPDPRSADDEERSPAISEGLRHLFPSAPADERQTDREQSTHFEAFLAGIASRTAPATTGAPSLDRLLAGGLRPGLWLVRSAHAGLATAFLDSLVWATVDTGRPVVLYPLRTGIQTTWERLLAEFGERVGDPLDLAGLRASHVTAECIEHARRLDAGMVRRLFPFLRLEDVLPAESRSLLGLLSHVEDLLEESDRAPLLLIDGLAQLAVLVGLSTGRSVALFSETDDLLRRHESIGVIAAGATLEPPLLAAASGVLELGGTSGAADGDSTATVEARIELLSSRWNAAPGEAQISLTLDLV